MVLTKPNQMKHYEMDQARVARLWSERERACVLFHLAREQALCGDHRSRRYTIEMIYESFPALRSMESGDLVEELRRLGRDLRAWQIEVERVLGVLSREDLAAQRITEARDLWDDSNARRVAAMANIVMKHGYLASGREVVESYLVAEAVAALNGVEFGNWEQLQRIAAAAAPRLRLVQEELQEAAGVVSERHAHIA